jgi:hypothetical protein
MLDKLDAASSSSACKPVAATLRLQAAVCSAIGFIAQQYQGFEHAIACITVAPGLLQQVQRALALLSDTSAPGDFSSIYAGILGSNGASVVLASAVQLQQSLLQLLWDMWSAGSADVGVLDAVLGSDSLAEAAMQLVCAYTSLMYDEHTAAAAPASGQQGQQQQVGGNFVHGIRAQGDSSAAAAAAASASSSSSSIRSSSACAASCKRPVQVGLLPISPMHERLQLLPAACRQLCLQEVQKAAPDGSMDGMLTYVQASVHVLSRHLDARTARDEQEQQQQREQREQQHKKHDLAANSTSAAAAAAAPPGVEAAAATADAQELAASYDLMTCPVTTEQAVLLVIELLQLLAAMLEQSDQQLRYDSLDAYGRGASLLNRQLVELQSCPALQERHSSVVQQSAQQLMQLLCWQLQQAVQRSTPPRGADASAWEEAVDSIRDLAKRTLFDHVVDRYSGVCLRSSIH